MGDRRHSSVEQWELIPKWDIVEKFEKGRAVYVHPDLNPSQNLYKYMRADQAFRMLRDRAMWFAAPDQWDDPHERWWCDQLFRPGSHLGSAYAYGTCWTRRSRDEPFWRMYGCKCQDDIGGAAKVRPSEIPKVLPAVRFRARCGSLLQWIQEAARTATCKAYMGKVRYCPIEQLAYEAKKLARSNTNASPLAATGLHLKRKAYEFEAEVRMLWIDRSGRRQGHPIGFEPLDLFDQVMIGPTKVEHLERYLYVESMLVSLGIPPEMIVPSTVFRPPEV